MGLQSYLKTIRNCIKIQTLMIFGVISKFFQKPGHAHICGHHYMIKLIKITIKYIKGAYIQLTNTI